jgi:hypothetical protein
VLEAGEVGDYLGVHGVDRIGEGEVVVEAEGDDHDVGVLLDDQVGQVAAAEEGVVADGAEAVVARSQRLSLTGQACSSSYPYMG